MNIEQKCIKATDKLYDKLFRNKYFKIKYTTGVYMYLKTLFVSREENGTTYIDFFELNTIRFCKIKSKLTDFVNEYGEAVEIGASEFIAQDNKFIKSVYEAKDK